MQTTAKALSVELGLNAVLVARALATGLQNGRVSTTTVGDVLWVDESKARAAVLDFLNRHEPGEAYSLERFAEEAQLPRPAVQAAAAGVPALGVVRGVSFWTRKQLATACINRGSYPLMRSVS